jgi:hypothetical protein
MKAAIGLEDQLLVPRLGLGMWGDRSRKSYQSEMNVLWRSGILSGLSVNGINDGNGQIGIRTLAASWILLL